MTKTTGTLHGDFCACVTISRRINLRTRNVSDKNLRENQNPHFTFKNFFLFFENRTVYEIKWGKKHGTAKQATDDNMVHAHCMLDT